MEKKMKKMRGEESEGEEEEEEEEEEEAPLEYDDGDSDFYEEGDSKRRRLE